MPKIAIKANINDKFLSAEYGGGQEPPATALTANREEIKGYETFEEVRTGSGTFALKTDSGNYLTADIDGSLRTNASEVGAWENFSWDGSFIKTFHGTQLTTRIDKDANPIETTENRGDWELFSRISQGSEVPAGNLELDRFPRIGTSVASVFLKNAYNYRRFAQQLEDNRMDLCGINLLSAQWPSMAGEQSVWPWYVPPNGGPWNLLNFNQEYQDKLYNVISEFHQHNVHVILVLLELYSWSNRKRNSETPDANQGHWRNNVNGVRWGGKYNGDRREDDQTLVTTPDDALKAWLDWMAPIWKINGGISVKIGNEYPEKALHERMRDYIHRHNPNVKIVVNRNEDTPGQYQNMKIGRNYDLIDYHGWKSLSFLTKDYGGPGSVPQTFKQFFDKKNGDGQTLNIDFNNCIVNSDGARANDNPVDTYNWNDLFKVHEFCWNKGCSIDHQSQVKMTGNLDNLEVDYLRRLASLR